MSDKAPPGLEHDFDAIEAAVRETARGRWFLGEFARRNRTADTGVLLDAIRRLEGTLGRVDAGPVAGPAGAEPSGADRAPSETEGTDPLPARASELLARIAGRTGTATAEILEAAERIQEAGWTLREAGADPATCDELERRAVDIASICGQQDVTVRRMRELLGVLRILEERIASALANDPPAESPRRELAAAEQPLAASAPESVLRADREALPRSPSTRGARPGVSLEPRGEPRPIPESLAALDALSIREKLKLFT